MYIAIFVIIVIAVVLFVNLHKTGSKKSATYNLTDNAITSQTHTQQNNVQNDKQTEQQRLVTQYANSELLVQILNYICDGNYKLNKPREIIISHDNIKSDISGKTIVFDFVSNRVPKFEPIFGLAEEVLVRPQVAMAEAINKLMGNEYKIIDRADGKLKTVHYSDGETGVLRFYSSNYIQMQLKAIKNF